MLKQPLVQPPRSRVASGLLLLLILFPALVFSARGQAQEASTANTLITFLWSSLVAVLVILAVGASWYWSLKRTVAVKTRELREALDLREQAEQELWRVANFDGQTGLANLQYFTGQVDDYLHAQQLPAAREKEILILTLVDLDRVVRTFGFPRAELVVNAFAALLLKLPDTLAAYLGRGVFALFLDKGDAQALFDRLAASTTSADPGLNSQFVGGSAYWPEHGRSAGKLMRHAETAMAVGIARRRRWMAYDPSMEPSRLDLDIVSIFAEGNVPGIFPVFQPQLDLRTGKITSAEILVRWQHPRLGFIAPNVFIPLLENAGMIERITAYMLEEAVRVATALRQRHLPCAISVNIAAYDLVETGLVDKVRAALARYQGLASDIKLELTETSVANDPQRVKQVLLELGEAGVYTSVDDFGTGYSSLSYLSIFPIRELKIDRTFVGDMTTNPRNHSIVRSTIVMARELGLITVAEGVEDDKTLQLLKQDGCDFAQGYVVAKPMVEAEFIEFMRAHAAQVFDISQFMKQ